MKKSSAKNNKKGSLIKNIRRSIAYFWGVTPGYIVSHVLLMFLQVASNIASIYFFSQVIGELTRVIGTGQAGRVYFWLILSGISLTAERFAWRWLDLNSRKMWTRWYTKIVVDYNAAVSRLDMQTHHDEKFTKMLAKVQASYQYTPANFGDSILNGFHAFIRLGTSLIAVLSFAPPLLLIMSLSLVPTLWTEWKLSKLQWMLWDKDGDRHHLAYRTTYYLIDKWKLPETKIFGTRSYLLDLLNRLYGQFYGEQLKNFKKIQSSALISLAIETGAVIGSQIWLLGKAISGQLSMSSFTFYSGIITQFNSSLSLVARSGSFLNDQNQYMKDFYKLLDMEPLVVSPPDARKLAKTIPVIVFEDVSFKYPNSDEWVLRHVSFEINPAEKIAFVGENGAGKSTIINLLLRFYDPQEGRITINGHDIREINLDSYYRHVGVLFQHFNDYPYSVRDNIALGRVKNFNDDKGVENAAKLSGANKFIDKYPKKYDQILEIGFKDGIEPSGGQWQRIALARALFRNADVLILDEPTAAVDAKSEYAIFKTLEEHSKDKTTIIISHRFSTVRNAEKIYVLNEGTITEQGSHESLMKIKNGLYKEMFDKQAEGYK